MSTDKEGKAPKGTPKDASEQNEPENETLEDEQAIHAARAVGWLLQKLVRYLSKPP